MENKTKYLWVALRIVLGLIFLWAFFDKLIGLGFSTLPEKAWLLGNSPTAGFLSNTKGLFSSIFHSLAGLVIIDWLFMLGLLFIGASLLFGIALRLFGYLGALLMFLMWLAAVPPASNPLLDSHIVYGLVFIGIAMVKPYYGFGFGKSYYKCNLVKKYKILQ
mgnify:CR=1 FL=1